VWFSGSSSAIFALPPLAPDEPVELELELEPELELELLLELPQAATPRAAIASRQLTSTLVDANLTMILLGPVRWL
jgi:hypothetical protein